MTLVDHDLVVDAVPADGTDHPFYVGILPRKRAVGLRGVERILKKIETRW